ncbi:MAG: hypothetical protein IJP82_02770 [Bacteroidaceae bacterium]|nr:hypothetical protein [Bacteroidaceae bacterium]
MKKILSLLVVSFSFLVAFAQLDNTVEVTNEVKPVVKDVKKVDVKAKAAETKVTHYTMEYAVQGQPLNQYTPEPLGDYTSEAVWKGNKKGYVHLAGGSHGNVDGLVGYLFDLTDHDALGIDLSLKGFNGKAKDNGYYNIQDWRSRDYHSRAGLKYTHRFANGADFFAKGAYENRMFNYMEDQNLLNSQTDKQHNVLANFDVGLTPYQVNQWTFGLAAGVDFFSQKYLTSLADKLGETFFRFNADAAYQLADGQSLGLGLGFAGASYGNDELDGFTRFRFTPHYIYTNEQMGLKLGLFVSTKGNVAPDVAFTYHLNPRSEAYVEASGHEDDNTFRRFTDMHPAFCIHQYTVGRMEPEFHQVDIRVGYRFKTLNGFSGHINGGFDLMKNSPDMDWISNSVNGLLYPWMELSKSKRFYVNADFVYNYQDIVKVDAKNQLNFDSDKDGDDWVNGSYITPAFQMLWRADVKIVKDFYFGLDWEYAWYNNPDIDVVPGPAYERPATVNLGASLHYTLPVRLPLTVFVKGDNLLNQKFDRYFGYRDLGTNFIAGFALSF